MKKVYAIVSLACFLAGPVSAQNDQPGKNLLSSDTAIVDVARVRYLGLINRQVHLLALGSGASRRDSLPDMSGAPLLSPALTRNVSTEMVEKTLYLQFPLVNSADTAVTVYFFPGVYFTRLELFRSADKHAGAIPVHSLQCTGPTDSGFLPIRLGPGEKAWFLTRMRLARTPVNSITPQIVEKDFMSNFRIRLLSRKESINLITYLTSGILLMMIFYSLAVYFKSFNSEFLYYAGYASFLGLLLFLKSYLFYSATPFNYFFEGWLDFIIQGLAMLSYFVFTRKFLDTGRHHPFLEKLIVSGQAILIACLFLYSILYFFTDLFIIPNAIENLTKLLLLVIGIVFIIYGLLRQDPLMNYLVAGVIILTVFSIISFLMILTHFHVVEPSTSILNDSLLYYEAGVVLELICFLTGLAYKNRKEIIERVKERERLKLDNERKELEKHVAVLEAQQEERNRISRDMHDELGSGVTAIRLMSEIVKSKMKEQTLPEIDKISWSANELLNKMNTIIWTMTSSNDSVENLVAYIRAYAVEFFENTSIQCHFSIPLSIPDREISGEKRRNIFLSVKESLNNVLKHSHADTVQINISADKCLVIEIIDNGVGIDMDKLRKFGNGLSNMKKRMAGIDGEFRISNEGGTRTILSLAL